MNCTINLPFPMLPSRKPIFVFINVLVAISAVIGNVLVLLAVTKTPRLHTVSNYFVCSLAVADLIVGLVVAPLNAIRSSASSVSMVFELLCLQTLLATTMNLAAVSIDRYIAIVKPLHYLSILTPTITWTAISLIWLASTIISLPSVFINGKQRMIFWLVTVLVTLVIPLGIVFYCYEKIRKISKLHQSGRNRSRPTSDTMLRHIKNRKASMTFAIIIAVFLVSSAPNLILNIIFAVKYTPCRQLPEDLLWANTVMLFNSALNPVIYGARNRDYRTAFKRIIFRPKI